MDIRKIKKLIEMLQESDLMEIEVKEGEELAVVEAMKMENSLRATQDGIVGNVHAQQGDSLAVDQIILEFK